MSRRVVLSLVVVLAGVSVPRVAAAAGARYAVIVQGASGEEQYATLHRRWLNDLRTLLRETYHYDAAHLFVLAEQPVAGEEKSTAEAVKSLTAKLATTLDPTDQLIIVMIGHGSGDGPDAKFNLIGPDLSATDWAALLKPIRGRLAVVDTTSASFAYLGALSAPGRVVITANNSFAQRYHTVFPDGFLQAFSSDAADLDKNGRISLLEAFTFASRIVKQAYEQKGTMATEVALLDDDGDGKGRDATAKGTDGAVAGLTYFQGVDVPTTSDPELRRLFVRRQELTDQIDELRRKRPAMTNEDYQKEFERLATELAIVSSDVRKRTGG